MVQFREEKSPLILGFRRRRGSKVLLLVSTLYSDAYSRGRGGADALRAGARSDPVVPLNPHWETHRTSGLSGVLRLGKGKSRGWVNVMDPRCVAGRGGNAASAGFRLFGPRRPLKRRILLGTKLGANPAIPFRRF